MTRLFPVLLDRQTRHDYGRTCPPYIPWWLIEPHRPQAMTNHSQSLEELNERGGLSPEELYAVLQDRPFAPIAVSEAIEFLRGVVGVRWETP